MHPLLEKFLKKQKIESVTELRGDEKETFDRWEKILSEGEITVDKIAEFCQNQINLIESKWQELDNSDKKNDRLVLLHTVYRAILSTIKSPAAERESLERYLNQLLQNK